MGPDEKSVQFKVSSELKEMPRAAFERDETVRTLMALKQRGIEVAECDANR